jgi:hypothetical protein
MGYWGEHCSYMESTFAARCDGQTSKKARTEEPRCEDEPGTSGKDPLEQSTCALDGRGEKEKEEGGSGPCPGPLEEDNVEGAAFGRQGIRGREGVGLGSEEGVGGVEISVILKRIIGTVGDSDGCKDKGYDTQVEFDGRHEMSALTSRACRDPIH